MPVQPLDHGELGAVLLRDQADGAGLDPQREVLGDEHDVGALGGEVGGDGQDAAVAVGPAHRRRQHGGVDVVELDPQRAVADRDRLVEPAVDDPQVVEQPQRLPREPAELGVVALALELAHDDERQDDVVLGEARHRPRVGQQDGGVEHEDGHGQPGLTGRRARPLRRR